MPSIRRLALTAAPLAAALGWLAAPDRACADRVDAFAALGQTVSATVERTGDVATVGFLIREGSGKKLSVLVKPAKKSALVLDARLVAPDGSVVDVTGAGGSVRATTKQVAIVLPNVPAGQSGLWRVEVRGAGGSTGACTVTVKGKDVSTLASGQTVPAGGSLSVPFDAGSNQMVTLTVRRGKGAKITPRVRVLDPYGNPLSGGAFVGVSNAKSGVLTLKAYRLPVFGRYTFVVSGENNLGGAVAISAKTAPAKPLKTGPVANAGAPTDAEPATAKSLDGTASRPGGGGTLAYLWTQVAGPEVDLTGADTSAPSFVAPAAATSLAFHLAVAENGLWSAPVPVTVEVGRRPLADAGRSVVVAPSSAVTLDGAGSVDRRGGGILWSWRQDPADPVQVTLAGADTPAPTFTAPAAPGVLRFGLTVDDGSLRSFEDTVTVRVGDAAQPVADGGRSQVVRRMATVHLSALASRTTSGVLDGPFTWTQLSGPAVVLDNASSPFPAFTAPKQAADLLFEVSAGAADAKDRVWVHVRPGETNTAPYTRGNGVLFTAGGNVTLNAASGGAGSADPDGNPLLYRWAQVDGPALALSDPAAAAPTVNVPAGNEARVWVVQSSDGLAYGQPDFVHVRNAGYAGLPVANAGPDSTVQPGQQVTLDGRGSSRTQGAGPVTYSWRQVSSRDWYDVDAAVPSFDPTAAAPTFTLPLDVSSLAPRRTMTFELVVNDGTSDSLPDHVTVTFLNIPLNGKPVATASASPSNPLRGQLVTLQGTASDRDGDPVTVRWTQKSGPTVVLGGGGATSLTPTFAAPASGTMVFELVANDGFENGLPATTQVVVDAAPTAVASASPPSGVVGTAVTIDGSKSADPENQPLTYTWTQTSGPTVAAVPTNTSTQVWAFTAPAQSVTFRLVVNDGRQNSDPALVTFQVGAPVTATPTASASSAAYGANVTLNAGAGGTGPYTYTWTQLTTGPNATDPVVTINNPTAANPTFTVPRPTASPGFGANPGATFQVSVSNGSNSAQGNVRVSFFASFNDAAGAGLGANDRVYGIIQSNCTSCHSGSANSCPVGSGSRAQGYGMGTASAFRSNSIGASACSSSKSRIAANSASNSFVVDRIKGIGGSQMGSLSGAQIALIEDWVNQGALDN